VQFSALEVGRAELEQNIPGGIGKKAVPEHFRASTANPKNEFDVPKCTVGHFFVHRTSYVRVQVAGQDEPGRPCLRNWGRNHQLGTPMQAGKQIRSGPASFTFGGGVEGEKNDQIWDTSSHFVQNGHGNGLTSLQNAA